MVVFAIGPTSCDIDYPLFFYKDKSIFDLKKIFDDTIFIIRCIVGNIGYIMKKIIHW